MLQSHLTRALTYCAVLVTLVTFNSYSQTQTLRGYIANGSDTTKGYIKYKKWDKSPSEIEFKQELSQNFKQFKPESISGFGIYLDNNEVEKYQALNLKTEQSSDNIQTLSDSPEPKFSAEKWLYALVLVEGKLTLYNYRDEIKDHYLISKEGLPVQELIYKKYLDASTSSKRIQENQTFRSQLFTAASDCEKIRLEEVKKMGFDPKSLSKIVYAYNNCNGSLSAINQPFTKNKLKYQFKALAGVSFTKLTFRQSSGNKSPLDDIKFAVNPHPAFGFGLDLVPSRSRFNYFFEVMYRGFNTEGTYTEIKDNYKADNIYSYTMSYAKLNLGIKYLLSTGSTQAYIFIGEGNAFVVSQKSTYTQNSTFYSTQQTTVEHDSAPGFALDLMGGVGVQFSRFAIEGRVETSDGFSTYNVFKATPNTGYLVFVYKF